MDVKLEEMRTDKSSIISSLKSQMMQDDLAMSVEDRPQLDEMSNEYGPSKVKQENIMLKNEKSNSLIEKKCSGIPYFSETR